MLIIIYYYYFIGGSLELEDELFVQVKPGLSSFADNPKKVNVVLLELIIIVRCLKFIKFVVIF